MPSLMNAGACTERGSAEGHEPVLREQLRDPALEHRFSVMANEECALQTDRLPDVILRLLLQQLCCVLKLMLGLLRRGP